MEDYIVGPDSFKIYPIRGLRILRLKVPINEGDGIIIG
jgi:hypothetical protein